MQYELPKKIARDSTSIVKLVSPVLLLAFLLLQEAPAHAEGGTQQKRCQRKPMFEKSVFEVPVMEEQTRMDSQIEKPVFEKSSFEVDKMSKPIFEKPMMEKPVFQRECLESLTRKDSKADKNFVPFPVESGKEWGKIKPQAYRRSLRPHHELKISRSTGYHRGF